MSLKLKLTIGFVGVGLIPLLIVAAVLLNSASNSLIDNKFQQLQSLSEVKRLEVIRYLSTIVDQAASLAKNPAIAESVQAFNDSFQYPFPANETSTRVRDTLRQHYEREFISTLRVRDPSAKTTAGNLTQSLNNTTIALQAAYIVNNPNPVGSKEALNQAPNKQPYDNVHVQWHPFFRDYLERFGYYDIFLINAKGDIVYSVYKEVDFATSLTTGPYAQSGLAQAFKTAMTKSSNDPVTIVDFTPYLPSYNSPAAFMAAPIYSGNQAIGVIALQFPIDELNSIMAEREGIGETGETYLVGDDLLMRSDSYLDPENFSVVASFQNPSKGSVDTDAIRTALNGESGIRIIENYLDEPVLSSFKPLDFDGLNWVILADIDEHEVMADITKLRIIVAILLVIAIIVSLLAARYFVLSIIKPLGGEPDDMVTIAAKIADGDLTAPIVLTQEKNMQQSLMIMSQQLQTIITEISHAAQKQAAAAGSLAEITEQTNRVLDSQLEKTEQVSISMNQMSASVGDVSGSTSNASESAQKTRALVTQAGQAMELSAKEIHHAVLELDTAKEEVATLNKQAESISSIMATIRGIAEQTNLLALNAAIESARAGEQGRGFAVVADEVRSLAQSTQNSAAEISEMIKDLQKVTDKTTQLMLSSVEQVRSVSDSVLKTSEDLGIAVSSMVQVDDSVLQIASAAQQQTTVASSISKELTLIYNSSKETQSASQKIAESSRDLSSLSSELLDQVKHFSLPGTP